MAEIEQLEGRIRGWLKQYCRATPGADVKNYDPVSKANRPRGRPYSDEATAFLLGLEKGLVAVTRDVPRVQFPGVAIEPRWVLGLFFQSPRPKIRLWWELLTQSMAAVELMLDYGWKASEIGIDVDGDRFDVAAYSPQVAEMHPLIVGEAKPSQRGVYRLLEEMEACRKLGCRPSDPDHRRGGEGVIRSTCALSGFGQSTSGRLGQTGIVERF